MHSPPRPAIFLSLADAERLRRLELDTRAETGAALLREELERAHVCAPADMPARVVRIGSRVRYRDLTYGYAAEVRVVMPSDAVPDRGAISVAGLPGAALIGVPQDQCFRWRDPDGPLREIFVSQVLDDFLWC
jgi:regulator of nucleoside diphosphate kinase